jgi:hypothetical protein
MRRAFTALGMAAAILAAPACVVSDDIDSNEYDSSELRDLYEDGTDLELRDLLSAIPGFAAEEINGLIDLTEFAELELEPTELYALSEDAADSSWFRDLDGLVSGLVHKYGERELTTEVNVVRRNHLLASDDKFYAESQFALAVGLFNWGHYSDGWDDDITVRTGFDASKRIEARVVTVGSSKVEEHFTNPLRAAKELRGFVFPRSVDELKDMKPGESYALRGSGKLGVNLGVGVPILTSVVDTVTYNIVLSAGMRTLLEGAVDVQVIRLDGNRIVVDVGIENAFVKSAKIALRDGWGIQGLVEANVSLGPVDLDLGRLVEKALESRLNKKLQLVDGLVEKSTTRSRISVARFRIDLAAATSESPVEIALEQLLMGDLRLAQALSNRYEPGLETEFELSRSGVSATSYAGIDIFGMSFFRKKVEEEGTIVVQTPSGAQAIHFESLHKESGWLFETHGYSRVGLAGMVFNHESPNGADGQANLLVQLLEGDKLMERDQLLDHIDGLILGVAGEQGLAAVEGPGNELQRYVENACPNSKAFDPCPSTVLSHPKVAELQAQAQQQLSMVMAGDDESLRDLALEAARVRLITQATYEPKASWRGPPTSIVMDYRLDDTALDSIMLDRKASDVEAAFNAYLKVAHIDRDDSVGHIANDRKDLVKDYKDVSEDVGKIFSKHAKRYRSVAQAEAIVLPNHPELGNMGSCAIEIKFPIDKNNVPKYDKAVSRSMAQARAKHATRMFDKLLDEVDDAKGLNNPEAIVAYMLMALTPRNGIDVRIDVDMDLDDNWAQSYKHYREAGYESFDVWGKGNNVSRIEGGLFDLDELLELD